MAEKGQRISIEKISISGMISIEAIWQVDYIYVDFKQQVIMMKLRT